MAIEFENRLKQRRQTTGLSQQQLAAMAGITRQAVAAVENGQYSPATSVALQLARALKCRVEDLFSIKFTADVVEGEILGTVSQGIANPRAQLIQVGQRLVVRPLDGAGELRSLAARADGLIVGRRARTKRVAVKLLRERDLITRQIAVGGCDPGMFLAAKHLGRWGEASLIPCIMGNAAAVAALARGEVHAAGVHGTDDDSEAPSRRTFRRDFDASHCLIVTFAHWEEGLIVCPENRQQIRSVSDLARPHTRIINREKGSGARLLLDRKLRAAGIPAARVQGYTEEVLSHLEVASRVRNRLADAGVGIRAAATVFGLEFISLERERYDLVIPKSHYDSSPALKQLLDLIVEKSFRAELEAFGGYDTRDSGKIVDLAA